MKLCGLTQSWADTGGGVRTLLHAQREWCARHGIEHVLIVPGAEDTVVRAEGAVTYTVASPRVPGSTVYRMLLRSGRVLRILRAEMPDVIETHCTYNLPWTALVHRRRHGGLVSALFNTDVATAYVETPLAKRIGARAAHAARRLTERYLRALYSRCDVVVGISPAMAARLREIGVQGTYCVPLGVDLDTFTPARRDATLRRELGVPDEGLLLVYVGRMDGEKRPDLVLDAFSRLPAGFASLVMAGAGPMRETLEERARTIAGVRIMPFVSDRIELARLYASADIYVSAHAHETFGLSVVEAQACGLPVVGVASGAMVDRVQSGEGILVAPESAEEMAAAMVSTPRSEWPHMGERARRRVQNEFSWNRTFDTLLDIYRTHR